MFFSNFYRKVLDEFYGNPMLLLKKGPRPKSTIYVSDKYKIFLGWLSTLPYISEKYITKINGIAFGNTWLHQTFPECVSSQLIYWHARRNCNLWSASWFYCEISYIIDENSCLKYCIFTKLSNFGLIFFDLG